MPQKSQAERIHDRTGADLPINSRVAIAIVPDPFSSLGEKITVLRSLRDDPLAGLLSREQIDAAKFLAGRTWQELYEQSEIGSVQAIDPGKEAVDGGGVFTGLTDRQMRAARKFMAANKALGRSGAAIIMDILGRRLGISEAAARRGYVTTREREYFGSRFRECLETLAVHFDFAPKRGIL